MCELLSLKHPEQGAILSTQHNGVLADGECTPGAYPRSRSLCCVRLRCNADGVHRCSSGDAAGEVRERETPCQRCHYCAAGLNEHLSTVRNGGQRPSPPTVGGVDGGVFTAVTSHLSERELSFSLCFPSVSLLHGFAPPLKRWNHFILICVSKKKKKKCAG